MSSEITFTLKDFGMLLLWAGSTVAIWYLVLIFHKVYKTISEVHKLIERNRDQVDATLNEVPAITRNVQEITTEVSHGMQVFRPTMENVAETSDSVTRAIKDNQSITEVIVSFFHVLNTLKRLLDKLNSGISE